MSSNPSTMKQSASMQVYTEYHVSVRCIGLSVCRRIIVSASGITVFRFVCAYVYRCVGVSACRRVGVSACRRVGVSVSVFDIHYVMTHLIVK